ncbi:MAG: DUF192 domain-containing protein [Woeseiaceae bacterium]|nr:DUF192 domain-containing protein [Woeseiaceae bacterium]
MRAVLTLLLLAALAASANEDLDAAFERDVLVIEASEFGCYRFDIWLAVRRDQQVRGLMYVRHLPEDAGMLFVYPSSDYHSMWMKNTFIPLDMIFARSDGTIANIVRDTVPQSLESVSSVEPVSYVLELNAGTSERLRIDENSRLVWGPMLDDVE